MTSKQRAYLKGLAMNLEPIFQVGKSSVTPEIVNAITECFNTHELIKLSVLKNCFDDPTRDCSCNRRTYPFPGSAGNPARKLYYINRIRKIQRLFCLNPSEMEYGI